MKRIATLMSTVLVTVLNLTIATAGDNQMVKMSTNKGVIDIEVYTDQAPISARNFLDYVKSGFYDGVIFHRVMPGFVIQGGGFTTGMGRKSPLAPIQNEADNGLKNDRGTLSMARIGDPHSATSQFFINLSDNDSLDHSGKNPNGWGYAVFAKVVSGMEVVDEIATVATGSSGMHHDIPLEDVVIESAVISE